MSAGVKQHRVLLDLSSSTLPTKFLTTGQMAKIFGVAPRTVADRWCDRGLIPHTRIPGSHDRRVALRDALHFAVKHGYTEQAQFLMGHAKPDVSFINCPANVVKEFQTHFLPYSISPHAYNDIIHATAEVVRRPSVVVFISAWTGRQMVGALYRQAAATASQYGWSTQLVVVCKEVGELEDEGWKPDLIGIPPYLVYTPGKTVEVMASVCGQLPVRMEPHKNGEENGRVA